MIDTPWPLPTGSAVTEREQTIKSVHNMLRQHCDQTGQYTTLHPVAVSIRETLGELMNVTMSYCTDYIPTLGLHMTTSEPVHQHWSSPVSTPTTHHSHVYLPMANNFSPSLTTHVTTSTANGGSHNSPANTTALTTNPSDKFALTTHDTTAQGISTIEHFIYHTISLSSPHILHVHRMYWCTGCVSDPDVTTTRVRRC